MTSITITASLQTYLIFLLAIMQLKHVVPLVAATSLTSATYCANDNCLKAVKLTGASHAGSPGYFACYFARRVTTTPAPFTVSKTVWKTVSTTSTIVQTSDLSTTT
jgi:hypothetical protein